MDLSGLMDFVFFVAIGAFVTGTCFGSILTIIFKKS